MTPTTSEESSMSPQPDAPVQPEPGGEDPSATPEAVAAVVILAAGEGKRMRSARSKLLHEVAGHSLLSYAVTAATTLQPEHVVVVVGHLRDQVEAHLAEIAPHVRTVVQEEQRGTGHAVQVALAALPELRGRRRGHLRRRPACWTGTPSPGCWPTTGPKARRSPC